MKKRVLSLLLILSLLLSLPGMAFANATAGIGYDMRNPMGINSEMKISDLKTANGTWKNASIKVSEVQIDNVGYKKVNDTQEIKYADSVLRKVDAIKVKVTYTFSNFTGNKNSLIKDNLLAESIDALDSKGVYKDGGQIYSGFANALHNKVEKYTLGGKTYKGEWYGKKIKDVNFTKPVTMTGYIYLIQDKGKSDGATVNFNFSNKNNEDRAEAYFVFTNKALESRIKKTGTYIYGDDRLGIAKADFEMTDITEEDDSLKAVGLVEKSYRLGTIKDSIIEFGIIGSEDGVYSESEVREVTKATADSFAEDYELKVNEENGIYKVIGITNTTSKYVNIHIINKGDNYIVVFIYSDIKEKASADKLWESYRSNNDLSKATPGVDKVASDLSNTPKETSKKPLSKYTYGTVSFGTFASLEELQQVPDTDAEILRYKSKSGDTFAVLQFFDYSKPSMENIDTNAKKDMPNAEVGSLDQGNITAYVDNGYSDGSIINLIVVRSNKIYSIIIGLPLNAEAQKETIIKSYLMSLGYTEQQAEKLSTAAIFD